MSKMSSNEMYEAWIEKIDIERTHGKDDFSPDVDVMFYIRLEGKYKQINDKQIALVTCK